jgi:hypothetical protein
MENQLTEGDWRMLLRRIRDGNCTPFLGAGACYPTLPLGSVVAREWAQEYGYPLGDADDLARVAEFLAVQQDPMFPKEEFLDQYVNGAEPPDFSQEDEIHRVLADLPLPIYMTTNYDDFMMRALQSRGKVPRRDLCVWNKYIEGYTSAFDADSNFEPGPQSPVVFHLHGHNEVPESLVLAEGDYLDFLVNMLSKQRQLPTRIQRALGATSLLFIGYSLRDWSFRVVFRGILQSISSSLRRISVTVQVPPVEDVPEGVQQQAKAYLKSYYGGMDIRVYWGSAQAFASELRQRWEAFCHE